ncbi:hypothetical protein [Rhizobium tropici]|uniref:hypothetical protein n=1 Tax=Rhizobium tropici TaxID=398 RepID=UPI00119B5F5B|nr:hypothetical protein [Rhizobium tropici]
MVSRNIPHEYFLLSTASEEGPVVGYLTADPSVMPSSTGTAAGIASSELPSGIVKAGLMCCRSGGENGLSHRT